MLGWFYFTMPSEEQLAEQRRQQAIQDSLAYVQEEMEQEAFEDVPASNSQPTIVDRSEPETK